jgi:lysophospholipase L1-like esterase
MRVHRPSPLRALAAAVVLGAVALGASGFSSAASGATHSAFYLDLGASVSVGEQPTAADPRGQPTGQGFAEDLVQLEAERGEALQLVRLGCPGETTAELISGDGRCYDPPATQLAAAVSFLRANGGQSGLVTLDVGFDDVARCLEHDSEDPSCLDAAVHLLGAQLRTIVATLRGAAGPDVRFLGVGAYDPFLARFDDGPGGQVFAADSEQAMTQVNDEMARAYGQFGVPMVDVAAAFGERSADTPDGLSPDVLADEATRTCELTWMCVAPPYGPNFHPNDDGYRAIAEAIADALPPGGL